MRNASGDMDDIAGVDADDSATVDGCTLQLIFCGGVHADAFAAVYESRRAGLDDHDVDLGEMDFDVAGMVAVGDLENVVIEDVFVVDAERRDAVWPDEDLRRRGLLEEGREKLSRTPVIFQAGPSLRPG